MNQNIDISGMDKSKILYEVVAGSVAYGTNTPQSDVDLRGIFWLPLKEYLRISNQPPQQANNPKNDIIYYTLHRYLDLAKDANPNIIELLWMPEDCVKIKSPIIAPLFQKRKSFISKAAYFTHAAYAKAQIGKAKGQNKWINNPQPEAAPSREDFCYVIMASDFPDGVSRYYDNIRNLESKLKPGETKIDWILANLGMPFRPRKMSSLDPDQQRILLKHSRIAGLEHVPNTYRLYTYGDTLENIEGSGIFKNNAITTASIPIEDEWERFIGLLIYNENEYEQAKRDHKNYWTWKNERNDARWVSQERGEIDYDAKNMSHCMRLMLSAESILVNHEPIVRFEGKQLQMLKDIRAGKWRYNDIMRSVDELSFKLSEAYKSADLPEEMDAKVADEIFQEVTYAAECSETDAFCGEWEQ